METTILYPVTLTLDFPGRQSHWKGFLRLPLAIPVLLIAGVMVAATMIVAIFSWPVLLARGRIPRRMFDLHVNLIDCQVRALSYSLLLTDVYPNFQGSYPVFVRVEYPPRVSRWQIVVWKSVSAAPHCLVLLFLGIGALLGVAIAWIAISVTGHFPRGLRDYVAGVGVWSLRVQAYVLSLTDDLPPFSLSRQATAASRDTRLICWVLGPFVTLGIAVMSVATVLAAIADLPSTRIQVTYSQLESGQYPSTYVGDVSVSLVGMQDTGDAGFPELTPMSNKRFVSFNYVLCHKGSLQVSEVDFRLKDTNGKGYDPVTVTADGHPFPEKTYHAHVSGTTAISVLFEVENGAKPAEIRYIAGYGAHWEPTLGQVIFELR